VTSPDDFLREHKDDAEPTEPDIEDLGAEDRGSPSRSNDAQSFLKKHRDSEKDTAFRPDLAFTINPKGGTLQVEQPPPMFDPSQMIVDAVISLDEDPNFAEIWAKVNQTAAAIFTAPEFMQRTVDMTQENIQRLMDEGEMTREDAELQIAFAYGNLPSSTPYTQSSIPKIRTPLTPSLWGRTLLCFSMILAPR
jgi:hypothetical protein